MLRCRIIYCKITGACGEHQLRVWKNSGNKIFYQLIHRHNRRHAFAPHCADAEHEVTHWAVAEGELGPLASSVAPPPPGWLAGLEWLVSSRLVLGQAGTQVEIKVRAETYYGVLASMHGWIFVITIQFLE